MPRNIDVGSQLAGCPLEGVPKSVVIVGGSLAGLMQGLQLKRLGKDVTILERDPSNERSSNEAGIAFGANMVELLRQFDTTGVPVSTPSEFNRFSYRKYSKDYLKKAEQSLSCWGLLYRVLRANFDGFPSAACPNPPGPLKGDGRAEYRSGKLVTALQYRDSAVTVHFEDVTTKKKGTINADLVIGADGVHSTVRKLVLAPAVEQYPGYIVWRGTVPENTVSIETRQYFSKRVCANMLGDSYCICYVIPTDNGGFTSEQRLLNWVLYHNVSDNSSEMRDIFTDINGKLHHNTVPRGLVRQDVWERIRPTFTSRMAAPVADLLAKTDNPFVTKVNDVLCTTASFCDGRVILVGDALTTIRPHIAYSTEKAAFHTLSLALVWKGEKTLDAWCREVAIHAERFSSISRVMGHLAQGPPTTFLKSLLSYIMLLIRLKLIGR
ncbi:FAD binding domain protein [Xylaria intraflava]|nr:FAD binding domain protein [Xylaria intraflava]